MRVVPLITATLVLVLLYLFVMERETLLSWVGVEPAPVEAAAPAGAAMAAPVAEDLPFAVVVEHLVERDLESAIVLRGRTAASRSVEVRAQTTGLVISSPLARGSMVAEGDVLCELDPGTRAASMAEARARLAGAEAGLAEAELNRATATRLAEGGFRAQNTTASADAALEGARASVEAAHAGVEAAQAELDRLTITAPFAGLVEADPAETGSLMQAGGLCATVIQLDPLLIVGYAAEAQIDRLAVGAMAGAQLPSGEQVVGQVTFLARAADPATRTFRVEVTVPNPDFAIRDGLSADMLVAATATRGHLVPGSALTINDEGELGLRLVDAESRTFFQPVRVLRDAPQGFWVDGLPTEADVIVVGQEYVTDGIEVRVTRRGEE
ncbi:efflux RND transporter periplasmic adaptor subunit [Pararhodobacter aggregans]|uniref:Efflux RND transporter periplasmic adaptor subunit n=1 Tax=Pararhodobacter aggregans TaxID=404875 RepID=A0A2T7UY68_9RHOB|nr:efflux RND transporter periplasmic adaptor subunit [Pararhodobacter aggregans]PTX05197.1 multidrug efflux system membrane fusion protein [Pararhodobacter aggregans]PVE49496.1 efflux RND transporter periplasmic adaptor subunit [Pararhodobacter aggregans]